jgi:hypothetical protein
MLLAFLATINPIAAGLGWKWCLRGDWSATVGLDRSNADKTGNVGVNGTVRLVRVTITHSECVSLVLVMRHAVQIFEKY